MENELEYKINNIIQYLRKNKAENKIILEALDISDFIETLINKPNWTIEDYLSLEAYLSEDQI